MGTNFKLILFNNFQLGPYKRTQTVAQYTRHHSTQRLFSNQHEWYIYGKLKYFDFIIISKSQQDTLRLVYCGSSI